MGCLSLWGQRPRCGSFGAAVPDWRGWIGLSLRHGGTRPARRAVGAKCRASVPHQLSTAGGETRRRDPNPQWRLPIDLARIHHDLLSESENERFIRIFGYGALLWLATLTTVAYAGTCTTNAKTIRMGLLTLAVDPRIEIGEQLAVRTENSISGTTFSFFARARWPIVPCRR